MDTDGFVDFHRPETNANDFCSRHPLWPEFVKQSVQAARVVPLFTAPGMELLFGHDCPCVQLGPCDDPERTCIVRPDGGKLSFNRFCNLCKGTGHVQDSESEAPRE